MEKRKPYSAFRIIQIGPNKMKNSNFEHVLSLSGFDIYGTINIHVLSNVWQEYQANVKKLFWPYSKNTQGIIHKIKSSVKVYSSGQSNGHPSDFISQEPFCCWTTAQPYSWFAVDLGKDAFLIILI